MVTGYRVRQGIKTSMGVQNTPLLNRVNINVDAERKLYFYHSGQLGIQDTSALIRLELSNWSVISLIFVPSSAAYLSYQNNEYQQQTARAELV